MGCTLLSSALPTAIVTAHKTDAHHDYTRQTSHAHRLSIRPTSETAVAKIVGRGLTSRPRAPPVPGSKGAGVDGGGVAPLLIPWVIRDRYGAHRLWR